MQLLCITFKTIYFAWSQPKIENGWSTFSFIKIKNKNCIEKFYMCISVSMCFQNKIIPSIRDIVMLHRSHSHQHTPTRVLPLHTISHKDRLLYSSSNNWTGLSPFPLLLLWSLFFQSGHKWVTSNIPLSHRVSIPQSYNYFHLGTR